jgi:hypothetical protein
VTDRSQVKLGRVINKTFTVNIDFPNYFAQGADYTIIKAVPSGYNYLMFSPIFLLENSGYGGARTKGDGVQYCDMRGLGTGKWEELLIRIINLDCS